METVADEAAAKPLLDFVNRVLRGDIDACTRQYLTTSKLVALAKTDDEGARKTRKIDGAEVPDVRPIAVRYTA